jgi:transcription elongation factor GreA
MFNYFTVYLKSYSQVNEQVMASFLLVKELAGRFPHLAQGLHLNFLDLFRQAGDAAELFNSLRDAKLKEEFLQHIKLFVPEWADIYVKLFSHVQLGSIISSLRKEGHEQKLVAMVQNCFENYRDNKEAIVWIFKNLRAEPWFSQTGITEEKQLISLIHILDLSYRDIENHRNTTENRKTNKQVLTILFKEGLVDSFISMADPDTIIRIYTLIDDVKDLDPAEKLKLKSVILDRYPDFKFLGEETEKAVMPRGLLVTMGMYTEKQKQLQHIMDVEVPNNSKEIAFALSLGDLRENAEYKAAKEKQEILNSTVAKLKEEIERAQLVDPASVNTGKVSFGTRVVLTNEGSGGEEEYTILGPWESDPENRIISYLSPFGGVILNKKVGETFDFVINEEKIAYRVKEISAASF